ncbi:WD40/YVTN/BNR-like repeat-containing protein [Leeuwenhoekiella sp. W20_SRS_FM14]|uniref:WD40/YVTN/BNR-like repeat-containing protein n=1 Tax=Leeuwenhoekiella sp. W20_SRS_FM14 TaxID=3240270 RepID=UPI003F969673
MKKTLLLSFLALSLGMSAQKVNLYLLKNIKPRSVGPAGMSGRITSIDAVTANPDIIYAGAASGGIWKSTSGGVTWKPVFENEATASIGAVAIQQSNPAVVWAGTGEGNPRNSLNGGFGIYKTLDGGKTWKCMGLENTRHIYRVRINPTNPDMVYAAAIGSPWGEHEERGVYRTQDGGKSWEKILYVDSKTGAGELIMDPTNPNKLIAAMWQHKRDPWFFNSGGPGSGLYITYDGGDTWKEITSKNGLPEGDLGRMGLAIAANKPNIVYAYIESKKNALYRSEDGGENWKKVNDNTDEIGDRPFYYAEIYVAPNNENRVYTVFTYINVSEDGGASFKELMPAYGVENGVHPDHHAWYIHPTNPDFMIDGNDGGLNITRDGGKTWRFAENIPVGQFYHIAVDNEFPYNVYGGMQDNGSWRGPAYVWKDQGIRNAYWQEISFGDGFDVVPDRDNSQYGWSMSQQGFVSRYDWVTGNNYSVRPTHPDPEVELRFNWNAAINIDPFDNSTLYFGSQFVHKSTDKGLTWEVISPDLTTNNPEKQKQSESGGLTMDATGAENHTTILVIEPSPAEKDMLWTGSDDGKVFFTTNGGKNWTDVSKNIKGLPEGSWIAQIKASATKKGEALLVANNYRRFDYKPYAYRTTDYGKTWKSIVDVDDVGSYTLSILEDKKEPNLMFLGTDDGLYISFNAGTDWQKWTNGFPTVPVKDMVVQEREDDLAIATFGRSIWVLDDLKPLRALAGNKDLIAKMSSSETPTLEVFPPAVAYQNASQQPMGSRFGADATFNGENRSSGAQIKYFFKPKKDEAKKKEDVKENIEDEEISETAVKWDSITLTIYDGERLIRSLKTKTPDSAGTYSIRWYMDEKGSDRPSRTLRKRTSESGGVSVKPGTYKVVLNYGDLKDSQTITVKSDPRLDISANAINEIYAAEKNLEEMIQVSADAVKQLVESKNIADNYISDLKKLDKTKYKVQIDSSKAITKKIDAQIALFLGKEDDRQGITRNKEVTVLNRIYSARGYVGSRPNGLTKTENILVTQAKEELTQALAAVNTFFNEDWKTYKAEMQKLELDPFKEIETFEFN